MSENKVITPELKVGGIKHWRRKKTARYLALTAILSDPYGFISRLKVKDKAGRLAFLKPTSEQMEIIKAFIEDERHLVILKPRQIGSSTISLALLFWKWYTSPQPISVAILSHKLASSKHLLEIFMRFWDNLPLELQRGLKVRNTTQMQLEDTGAKVEALSAEGHGGLRSFSANYIHLSEYAFAPNGDELKATALASLNEGRMIQESTANYWGDAHHSDVLKAQRGEGDLRLLFFPWSQHEEYSVKGPRTKIQKVRALENWNKEVGDNNEDTPRPHKVDGVYISHVEMSIMESYGLTIDQILWRRIKVEQFGEHKFRREFPLSIEEAYGSSSNAYFKEEDLGHIETYAIDTVDGALNIIEDFRKETAYALGVDVATGVERDFSAIQVLDKTTWRQVAVWSSNKTSISETADMVQHMSSMYGDAKTLIEENNIGHALLLELRSRGFTKLWSHPDTGKDWSTNVKTKWVLFEELKEVLTKGIISNIDVVTMQQLRSFIINDKGNIDYASRDSHGDQVVALALAIQCLKQVTLPRNLFLPEWVKTQRFEKAAKKYSNRGRARY